MQAIGQHFSFLDKEFVKKTLTIALPIAATSLINFGVKAVDTLMLGIIGEVPLSAAALANQLSLMFLIFASGVGAGCGVLASQYWGAGDKQRVREIFAFMLRLMVGLNIVFASIAFFAPHIVLGIMTTDADVIAYGTMYLRIMSAGYLVSGLTTASTVVIRSVGIVKMPMIVYSASLVVSASLGFILIFGHLGFPALGIRGAAIATTTARFVEVIIISICILKFDQTLGFRAKDLFGRFSQIAKGFVRFGVPVVLNEALWAVAFFVLHIVIGRMGREFVAANAIGGLIMQFNGMFVFSMASAMAVIIGNTIGEGRYERAQKIANGALWLSFIIGLLCAVIVQIIRVPFVNFYNLSDVAHMYAMQITNIISVNVIFVSVALISLMGTLRGGGDGKFVMIVDVIFMIFIAIPLGAYTGLVLGWPVWIVFIILRSEDFFKTMVVLWRVPRGKWIRDVMR